MKSVTRRVQKRESLVGRKLSKKNISNLAWVLQYQERLGGEHVFIQGQGEAMVKKAEERVIFSFDNKRLLGQE